MKTNVCVHLLNKTNKAENERMQEKVTKKELTPQTIKLNNGINKNRQEANEGKERGREREKERETERTKEK